MFKKILLLIVIFLPLWYSLFIGYPVVSDAQYQLKEKERPNISVSKRCFGVGDFRQFSECFSSGERISGKKLFYEIAEKTNKISPLVTFLFISSLTLFIITSIMWFINENEEL